MERPDSFFIIIPALQEGREFFNDPNYAVNKDAYVC